MRLSMLLGAGMTPGLPAPFMKYCQRSCQLDTTWSPTLHSHEVPAGALGKYMLPFGQVQTCQMIWTNLFAFLPLTANSSHSNDLWDGGCVPCRACLAACVPLPFR
jgi:hypothetical protein